MDREVIDVVELRAIPKLVELKDAFEFRKDRPAPWLQKACLWVLRKLGCFACKETVTIERHAVGYKGEKFMERLWARKEAVWGDFGREPTKLYLGAGDYQDLMMETCTAGFSFETQYHLGRKGRREVMGLHVEVIPHMRGMLLI